MGSIPMSEANPYNTQEIQHEKSERERGPIMVSGANHTPDSARLLYTATPAPLHLMLPFKKNSVTPPNLSP
jgi:hypothetical protein